MMADPINKTPVPDQWAAKFFTIWVGQAFSLVGSSLVQFALVWWLTRETGSATVLATATLIAMLPQIFLGPFAGTFIDRWNRKTVMIVADSLIALATLALIYLFSIGRQSIWAIYAILLIRSAGGSFHYPALQASTSLMVPKQHLARIAGLNQTLHGVINIIAPPLGALLISILPTQSVLFVDVITAAIAVSLLAIVSIPQPARIQAQANGEMKTTSFRQDLREGWDYMAAWPGLLAVAILAMLINFLLTPASSLIPLMVTKEYLGGAPQLGLLDSIFGIGVIVGGLILSAWGGFKKRILTSLVGIVGIGAGILVFGSLPPHLFYLALSGIFMLGFMQVFANGPLHAILQATVDPGMQGRVLSLINAGATAMSPLSLLVAGPVADALGVRTWYLIGGSACILAALCAMFIPAVMTIESNQLATVNPTLSRQND
ncbi:MAG: MFS transporter [Chloroflexi bacterium GWB2_49_20]|nr:MAG: MFS transporter [Chloroflexi bacterium GWB2_49_20]OGN77381.1 MAG: MFS transporter [Chloroflexi bacterium GWC2_49_37]OGN85776.1 MAG: MFS transporter [Chloroflexi bacterium GWD2_49_16]